MPRLRTFLRKHSGACLCVLVTLLCTGAWAVLYARRPPSLLETANKLGPAAESLVHGLGLAICYGPDGGQPCFYAQRMPAAPAFLALLYRLFGEHGGMAALAKMLLCLAPVLALFLCISQRVRPASARTRWVVLAVLLLASLLPPALDLAVNLNFEEAYFYGWLALATGLLLFPESSRRHPGRWAMGMLLSSVLCYLTKSSMLLVAGFLVLMAAIFAARGLRRPTLALVLVCAFALAPLLWSVRQHHASGRFTAGTSLDGANLYKGNNPLFRKHYPPFTGASIDSDEAALFAGRVSDTREWDESDFGLASAREYIHSHPAESLNAAVRKASVFFLGIHRNAADEAYSPLLEFAFTAGLVLFRVLLLSAAGLAFWQLFASTGERFPATVFLGTVLCVAAPYIAGFALTRHATVLILPAAAYLSRILLREARCPAESAALP